MFETWFQMEALLATGPLNLDTVITHRMKLNEFPPGDGLAAIGRRNQGGAEAGVTGITQSF